MPDAPPLRDPAFATTVHRYAKKYVFPIFEEMIPAITSRISALERREKMRVVARAALQEAGREPRLQEVERMVDVFVERRYTARVAAAEPPLSFPTLGPGWVLVRADGTEVTLGANVDDDATRAAAESDVGHHDERVGGDDEAAWLSSPR